MKDQWKIIHSIIKITQCKLLNYLVDTYSFNKILYLINLSDTFIGKP